MAHLEGSRDTRKSALSGLVFLFAFGVVACEAELPQVTSEESALVSQVAEPVAAELLRTLVGRLTTAVNEGGPAHAVTFCALDAIPLTRLIEAEAGRGMEVKRTSFRYRNPDNAPDVAEELALRYFEEAILAQGEAPDHFIQRVSGDELRYYQPLFVGEFHGDPDSIEGEVREALGASYPTDLATGYEAGDFRGVVRVSVPKSLVEGTG